VTTTSGMEADYDAHSEYQRRVVEGGDDPEAGRYEAWIVRVTFARSA
jgi:hypothetical protein